MFVWKYVAAGLLILWLGALALLGFGYVYYEGQLLVAEQAHQKTKTELADLNLELQKAITHALEESLRQNEVVINVQRELENAKSEINAKDATISKLNARGVRDNLRTHAAAQVAASTSDTAIVELAEVAAEGAELLAESGELLRQCAKDHDTRAAEVEALVKAWPVNGEQMTLNDIKKALVKMDEVTLLEILDISSEDLVERFGDFIEIKADLLEEDLESDMEFYDGQEDTEEA
jgi:hypothetical protein